jgi:hypothetical protein
MPRQGVRPAAQRQLLREGPERLDAQLRQCFSGGGCHGLQLSA